MVAFLKGQVADYKLPEMLVEVAELPMTPTGKLRRHVLSEQIAKRQGQRAAEADQPHEY
jgi:acyl-CoA synthetase (AMP-forming)/AMP-acid ligase II